MDQQRMSANGTLTRGTASFAAGKFSNAETGGVYNLGTTLDAGFVSGGNLTTGTVECWIKQPTAETKVFLSHVNYYFMQTSSGGQVAIYAGSGNQVAFTAAPTILDGGWHHVALVFDAGTISLYLDGNRTNTTTTAAPATSGVPIGIGGHPTITGNDYTGYIDEVRFSSIARYSGATYTVPTAAFTDDSNTLALYHLETDATDSHVSGGAVTAPGAPTGLTATAGNAQAALSWTAPSSNGGAAITDYIVQSSPDGTTWTTFADGTSTATSATVTGLTNGTAYTFRVAAVNSSATGTYSTTTTATPAASAGTTLIPANDANIVYSPYTWDVTGTRAATINPGAYARFAVVGATGVTLNFDMASVSSPVPRIKVRIDDAPMQVFDLAATIALTMPSTNGWANKHTVEITVAATSEFVNRWNPQNAIVKFTGATCASTGVTTRAITASTKNILIYGDSITEGYKSLNTNTTPDGSDAEVVWSYLQRRLLGVEVGVVGFGAQGWINGGQGGVPALPTSYNLLWSGVSRSFTAPVPDLVVINMGTNDSADITTVYTTFLNTILALNSTTKIAAMLPFSGAHAAQIQAAIAACTTPPRVTYVDTTGWFNTADSSDGLHPYGFSSQTSLAPRLANALRPILTGTGTATTPKRFVNVGGVAKAIA